MKITSLTVTAEDGTVHVAEGVGSASTEGGVMMAALTLVDEVRTVARSAESGRFTTAEDAAEHPATTVIEQL